MSQKTLFIIIALFLIIIIGFFLVAFFIAREEERPIGEVLRDFSPFGNIGDDVRIPTSIPFPDDRDFRDISARQRETVEVAKLYKISSAPVAGGISFSRDGTEYLRYVEQDTGHVYEFGATTTERKKLTNTSAPGIKEVFWGENGESLIVRYLETDEDTIKTFIVKVFLPREDEEVGETIG